MIYDYKIEKYNGKETLFLYFDLSFEFANLKKKNGKSLIEQINNFIKSKNIDFKGKQIAIISGSLLIGTLLFKTPISSNHEITNADVSYPTSVLVLEDNSSTLETLVNEKMLKKEEAKIEEKTTPTVIQDKKGTVKISKPKATAPTRETNTNSKTETPKEEISEDTSNQIKVTIKRKDGTILNLSLEEYCIGVVGAEMPASFHIEALKSQAILARTYALKSIEKNLPLTDDSSTQNYKSLNELKNMWGNNFDTYYNKIKSSVQETKGLYLTYKGQIIEAVYHSTSNGFTEDAKYVWGNSFPYLKTVTSPYDNTNSSYIKSTTIPYETLSNNLGITVTEQSEIKILSKTESNRVEQIGIDNSIFTGVQIRYALGLRSADFDFEKTATGLSFTTRGYGHGVGLSQYGANGLAKNGANYETILKHYYLDVDLSKI